MHLDAAQPRGARRVGLAWTPSHRTPTQVKKPLRCVAMHERTEEARQTCPLMRADAALALKMDIAIGVSLPGMNHPISGGRIVLQAELSAIPLRRWRFLADDAKANALLWSSV